MVIKSYCGVTLISQAGMLVFKQATLPVFAKGLNSAQSTAGHIILYKHFLQPLVFFLL